MAEPYSRARRNQRRDMDRVLELMRNHPEMSCREACRRLGLTAGKGSQWRQLQTSNGGYWREQFAGVQQARLERDPSIGKRGKSGWFGLTK